MEELEPREEPFSVDGEEIHRKIVAVERIPESIRAGEISHALVIVAFHLLDFDQSRPT